MLDRLHCAHLTADQAILDPVHLQEQEITGGHGELWANLGKSLRSIASVLGVDPLTVKRQASKERLTFPRLGKRVTNAEQKREVKAKNPETERAKRRAIWLSVTARIPATGAARKAEPAAYAWLRRNDQDWLAEHLPSAPRIKNVSRINWSLVEQELLARVPGAHSAIISQVPFVQCTLPALLYRIRAQGMAEHLDKMPGLAELLGRMVENEALFMLRRIATVCGEAKGSLSTEQVLEQAGIDRSYASDPGVISYVSEKLGDRQI